MKQNHWTIKYRSLTYIYLIRSIFVSHWSIVPTMVCIYQMGRVKRIWYLSLVRAAKVQASLRICAVSSEPPLLAHTSSGQEELQTESQIPGPCEWLGHTQLKFVMMECSKTNSLDAPQIILKVLSKITRLWNIGLADQYLFWGQSSGHTVSLSENMTCIYQIVLKIWR